jgi:hypothetical protein
LPIISIIDRYAQVTRQEFLVRCATGAGREKRYGTTPVGTRRNDNILSNNGAERPENGVA